jgi:tRNA A-37 threonylcarbamoyl transferase component Bud32
LARKHNKGILQKDMHLGNFLLKDNKVFLLDAGQMKLQTDEIGRKESFAQLAMLILYLPGRDVESGLRICEEYFKVRGWSFKDTDATLLKKQIFVQLQKGIKHGLKKCLRTSKRTMRIRAGGSVAVFDKGFCNGAEPIDFISQIDTLMDKGQILKNGNTCYVSRLKWNDNDVVVKRYNHKGIVHSLRHTIRQSRARRCWLHGHRLGMLKISTPKPLAYIEQRKGLLIWKSYLVTEYIQGQKLYDFLRDESINQERRSSVKQQVKELLEGLGKYRITHGDLKHSNVLITSSGPLLTDLDAMQAHKCKWSYRLRRVKDLERIKLE